MRGNQTIRFSTLFAETVRAHGAAWARKHYMRNGMREWEFAFWFNNSGV